ncbi:polysaccharide deacetylase family protein [Streptomyces sp. NPDC001796]|uniref:polysaccharide deacetylase family protein n=1 Tax=Streptomyces sp. NPDC001796 TaxID=3364609 RepID=UPI00368EDBE2
MRARRLRALLAAVLAAAVLAGAAGCAQSVDPIERLGKKAAQRVRRSYGPHEGAYRRWGLAAPLAPPPRPARPLPRHVEPEDEGLPEVLDRVPTHDRVVFLTYDEGAERDPRFAEMVRDLRLPVSVFLTDSRDGPGYARIGRLRAAGATIQNHTLDHAGLRGRPYAEQRAQICAGRDRLRSRLVRRPLLLRPPYGRYDRTTLRAAADCGIKALILWRPAHAYGRSTALHPGDILRPHEPGRPQTSLTTETIRVLRRLQSRGFTVARLEDYL